MDHRAPLALLVLVAVACTGEDAPDLAPSITAVAPSALRANEPASLRITGANFLDATRVTFDGHAVQAGRASATTLTVELPAALLARPHVARLTVANGGRESSLDVRVFAVPPAVESIEPASLAVGEARQVVVRGSGFLATTTVSLRAESVETEYRGARELAVRIGAAQTKEPGLLLLLVSNGDVSLTTRAELPVWPGAPSWAGLPDALALHATGPFAPQPSSLEFEGAELFSNTSALVTQGHAACAVVAASRTRATLSCVPTVTPAEAAGEPFTVKLQNVGPGRESAPHTFAWHHPRPRLASPRTHYVPTGTAPLRVVAYDAHPDAALTLGGAAIHEDDLTRTGAWSTRFDVRPPVRAGVLTFGIENPAPGGGAAEPLDLRPLEGLDLGEAGFFGDASTNRGQALLVRPGGALAWVAPDASVTELGLVPTSTVRSPGGRALAILHARGVAFLDLVAPRPPLLVETDDAPLDVLYSMDSGVALVRTATTLVHVTLATGAARRVSESRPPATLLAHLLDHPQRVLVASSRESAAVVNFEPTPPATIALARLQDAPAGLMPDGATVLEPRRLVGSPPRALPGRPLAASADGRILACAVGAFGLVRVDTQSGEELGGFTSAERVFAEPHATGFLLGQRFLRRADGALLEAPGANTVSNPQGTHLVAHAGTLAPTLRVLEIATGETRSAAGGNAHVSLDDVIFERADGETIALVRVPIADLGTAGQAAAELVTAPSPGFDLAVTHASAPAALLRSAFETEPQWLLREFAPGGAIPARFAPGTDVASLAGGRVVSLEDGHAIAWSP